VDPVTTSSGRTVVGCALAVVPRGIQSGHNNKRKRAVTVGSIFWEKRIREFVTALIAS
jgi:hypothetical protein